MSADTRRGHRLAVPARVHHASTGIWTAQVQDPASPLAGLSAVGATLDTARDKLAAAAAAALAAGELDPHLAAQERTREQVSAVRVYATAARTYPLYTLTRGAA